jgi:hypothetical protein
VPDVEDRPALVAEEDQDAAALAAAASMPGSSIRPPGKYPFWMSSRIRPLALGTLLSSFRGRFRLSYGAPGKKAGARHGGAQLFERDLVHECHDAFEQRVVAAQTDEVQLRQFDGGNLAHEPKSVEPP